MRYDLHLHTNYSDGRLDPKKVVDNAIAIGLDGIAITDHDSVSGIDIAVEYAKNKDLEIIPGIEFGTNYRDEEIHILGYFMDYNNKKFKESLDQLFIWRRERGSKILEKLRDIEDIDLNREEVLKYSKNEFIGRVPIALVLKEKGYVEDISDAFNKYLGYKKSCYVEKEMYNLDYIIDLIKECGGVASLAHPVLLKDSKTIDYCVEQGIDAIEAYHSKQSLELTDDYIKYACDNNIMITGGSDCHGRIQDGEYLIGKYYIKDDQLEKIRRLSHDRKNK